MKKILSLILITIALISLVSCSLFEAEEKVFEKSGLSITLTEDFVEKEHVSFTGVYESRDVAVYTLKEEFTLLEGSSNMTLNEYTETVILANKLSVSVETKDNLTYFKFDKEVNGKQLSYFAFTYKSEDAFWLVQIACETDDVSDKEEDIFKYANSVVLK